MSISYAQAQVIAATALKLSADEREEQEIDSAYARVNKYLGELAAQVPRYYSGDITLGWLNRELLECAIEVRRAHLDLSERACELTWTKSTEERRALKAKAYAYSDRAFHAVHFLLECALYTPSLGPAFISK